MKYRYEGDNNKNSIVAFMKNPTAKVTEPEWSEMESGIVHLTATNFDSVLKQESSALVMFYAPWCGHCKRMKPEYEKAAAIMKSEGVSIQIYIIEICYAYYKVFRFRVIKLSTVLQK